MTARRQFHSFDALRFFAFLKVFFLHIPVAAFPVFNFLKNGGGTGVIFFFVLSGFLITYILLSEKAGSGTINLKSFYLRRILRIWPLYYLILFIAFITPFLVSLFHLQSSGEGYEPNWVMSCLYLENYQMIRMNGHPNVSPLGVTWSLCIEEHFYLFWGLLLYFLPVKKLPLVLGLLLALAHVARYFFTLHGWLTIDLLTNIDYFVYGAIPAFLLVCQKKKLLAWITQISFGTKIFLIVLTIFYVEVSPNISYPFQLYVEPVLFGVCFSGVICLILPDKNALRIDDRSPFSRLGRYTYGMYLYHTIVINLLLHVFDKTGAWSGSIPKVLLFIVIAFLVTTGISLLSYYCFERYFLMLKKKWAARAGEEAITAFAGPVERPSGDRYQ
ncbi:MAG TPA: acyltransferase [Flavisolibacter sp.]|nr:acyltransferase [Flavisolibacter sp.]